MSLNREAPANIAPMTTGTKYSDSVEMPNGSVPGTFDGQKRLEPTALPL